MVSSYPNYLHADVSHGKDVSCHQQEVTDGHLVTMSLVPGTVDSYVALECHLYCPPPLPTEKVSSVDSSWQLCVSRLNWKKGGKKEPEAIVRVCSPWYGEQSGDWAKRVAGHLLSSMYHMLPSQKSSVDNSWELCVSRMNWKNGKKDCDVSMSMSVARVKEDSGDRVEDRKICLYCFGGEFWFNSIWMVLGNKW